uniref:DH domain-containing protein n=1 Tax=Arcella intermedia TaxID=1963864 RepID=A0A6B2LAA2_9EUKA
MEQLKNKQESLGKIFLNIADTMKLYIDYVNKFESANVIFAELSNDKFFQSMEQKGMELTGKYLRDYLITPIQRLPRYQLALETIIKHTEPTHEHYESLLKAKDKVQSVNIHINEKKRDYENRLRLLELATRIELPSYIVAPHRVCIFEGKMEMEKEGEEKKKVHVYLLNDLWIITEEKNDNQFVYVDKIALNDLSIAFVSQASFILTAGNVSWNCYCATPFEVNKWVNAIEDTLKSNELHDLLGEWGDYCSFVISSHFVR